MDAIETVKRLLRREEGWTLKDRDHTWVLITHKCGMSASVFRFLGSHDVTIYLPGGYTMDLCGADRRRVSKSIQAMADSLSDLAFTNKVIRGSALDKKNTRK